MSFPSKYLSFCLLFIILNHAYSNNCDSLGIIKKDGKSFIQYKIDKGNTFYSLSRRFNVSTSDIQKTNGIEALQLNKVILIPTKSNQKANTTISSKTHVVKPGETLYSISKSTSIPVDNLKKLNKLTSNELSVGQVLQLSTAATPTKNLASKKSKKHKVIKGDTFYSVSKKYNVSVNRLKQTNNITTSSLKLNQILIIPNPDQKKPKPQIKAKSITLKMLNSKAAALNQIRAEVMCPYGKVGDIVKLTHPKSKKTVYARIIKHSDDTLIYATNKIFNSLEIKEFSLEIKLTYFQ